MIGYIQKQIKKLNMINRYKDFLLESLLLESVLVYSDDFKNILKGIESPVATALIDIEAKGDDLTLTNNYIDITKNKEEISFITDKKAQQILKPENAQKVVYYMGGGGIPTHSEANSELFELLEYEPVGEKAYKPQVDEKGEVLKRIVSPSTGTIYLKIKFPGGTTVINETKVRYEDISNLPFLMNRQPIRVGRGIKAILSAAKQNFSDTVIQDFVSKYRSAIEQKNDVFRNFELVKGDKIKYWYHVDNYQYQTMKGTLSTSCMRYNDCQRYFQIYTQNPDVCSLLILKTEDGKKIRGRALVWNLSGPKEGITYMDRTYVHEDSDFELFRQYAKENGWYRKINNDHWSTSEMISPEGKQVDLGPLVVKIKAKHYDYYPYVDTLKYYYAHNGNLSTDQDGDAYELTDTSGGYAGGECDYCGGSEEVECPECGGNCEVDCYDCSGNGTVDCSKCDGDGSVECDECSGEGTKECDSCSGHGDIECIDCEGSGEDEEGEECSACEGKGKLECGECDSEGTIKCEDCSGEGKFECTYCEGEGNTECSECEGNGALQCDYCYGNGEVSCPECN